MSAAPSSKDRPGPDSAWAPFAARVFRALWIAQLVSNIGSWMQTVGAQWLLIGHGAALVTLVQTASGLPVVLLALPSGVLADRYDRRTVLLAAQFAMLAVSTGLAVLAFVGALTPVLLLGLTFLLGCGTALMGPAWQAIQPELVERRRLAQAAALGAVNMNLARALGPALGGAVVAAAGAGWVFAFNAASYLGIAAVLLLWRRPSAQAPAVQGEKLLTALHAGRRYVWSAPGVRRVLLRTVLFIPGGAALWSLLPLVASRRLGLGSGGYGLLLGAVGVGAVGGAFVQPASAALSAPTASSPLGPWSSPECWRCSPRSVSPGSQWSCCCPPAWPGSACCPPSTRPSCPAGSEPGHSPSTSWSSRAGSRSRHRCGARWPARWG
jgi:MFS family permease